MDLPRIILPYKDMLFSDAEHMLDIRRLYDVTPFKGNTLESIIHLGDIVT